MKKILLLSLLYGITASANSQYIGKYLCNSKQFVEITNTTSLHRAFRIQIQSDDEKT